jgi:small subunit ribosomal protein S6
MNIECNQVTLDEINSAFRFNDAVIRNLVIARRKADTQASPLAKSKDEERVDSDSFQEDDRPPARFADVQETRHGSHEEQLSEAE